MRVSATYNLAVCFPDVAAQWDHSFNGEMRPEDMPPGSHHRAGWVCLKDPSHRWVAKIKDRTGKKTGCPYCAGKLASPTHKLATLAKIESFLAQSNSV